MRVEVNTSGLVRLIARSKKQLVKATRDALNETAEKVKQKEISEMDRSIDRPTQFTKRGLLVRKSRGRNFRAVVQMKDIQANYLKHIIKGIISNQTKPIVISSRLNKFGNVPRRLTQKTRTTRKGYIVDPRKGVIGVWLRRRNYRKQYDFYNIGEKEAKRLKDRIFRKHLIKSLIRRS